MGIFHSLLLAYFCFKLLEESYSIYHGNIYGIHKLKGNKSSQSAFQHFWFKRSHVNLRLKYPKTLFFSAVPRSHCSQKKNIKTIKVKRIGGNYPYGPKLSSISVNKICRQTSFHLSSSPTQYHPSSISFSSSRLTFRKRAYHKPIKQVPAAKRKNWVKSKAWCAHCESYWKMKIKTKELKSRYGCC